MDSTYIKQSNQLFHMKCKDLLSQKKTKTNRMSAAVVNCILRVNILDI